MNSSAVGNLSLSTIIERKLSFLLNNDISPWEGGNSDLGERDALQSMLDDSKVLSESDFESKYNSEVMKHHKKMEEKEYSEEDGDDYYEAVNNTIVRILALINPINLYYPDED